MRSTQPFFKLFPPPTFMLMPHAGLEISDDAFRTISYTGVGSRRHIDHYASQDMPSGLFDAGDIKDEKGFIAALAEFGKKNNLSYVKVSVPEEKAYLFQTDVPSTVQSVIEQNIEFKLEENVPLSAADAVFYFDLLPVSVTGGALRASVSVVPRTYIEKYMALLEKAGLVPVSFETVPKSIARAVIPRGSNNTRMIIHAMNKKTGIYIVCGNVLNFAVTANGGTVFSNEEEHKNALADIKKEIERVRAYWLSHGNGKDIDEAILVGKNATSLEEVCRRVDGDAPLGVRIADIWSNAVDIDKFLPPINRNDSLEYAVAAGLAFDTHRAS